MCGAGLCTFAHTTGEEGLGGGAQSSGIPCLRGETLRQAQGRPWGTRLWGGRTTYRFRRDDIGLRLAYKKVVLVDNDQPLPTLGFVI